MRGRTDAIGGRRVVSSVLSSVRSCVVSVARDAIDFIDLIDLIDLIH